MNKALLAGIIAVVALLGIGGVLALNSKDKTEPATSNTHTTAESEDTSADNSSKSSNNSGNPNTATSPSPSAGTAAEVAIEDFAFGPATLTVKKGTTVKWTNKDSVGHTVTGKEAGGPDSEVFTKGESYSFTFDTVGTFDYYCTPHPQMTGKVVVTE